MQVDIYVRERDGNREIRFPWLPEQIKYTSGGVTMATYDILDRGEVAVPTGSGLAGYSWKSLFPGENRKGNPLQRGTWKDPKYYHNILKDWKKRGVKLHILVPGYPFNDDVILEDYEGIAAGGFGDIEYELSFIEDRDIRVSVANAIVDTFNRNVIKATGQAYTIKKGDTLWAISQKYYGAGSKWETIYKANKNIIESTAKKHGYSSSDKGWWIFPGVKLTIP